MAADSSPATPRSTRRARLLRFLAPLTVPDGRYEVRVGSARLSPEILTDDALEDLAVRVIEDFWSNRHHTRLNRPHYAAAAMAAAHHLPPETMRLAAALLGAGTAHAA